MRGIKLVPDDTNINFIGLRYVAFALSLLIMLGSVGLVAKQGLNFGIDFAGGTLMEIKTPSKPDLSDMRSMLNDLGLGGISIQEFGASDDLLIRLPEQPKPEGWEEGDHDPNTEAVSTIRAALDQKFTDGAVDYRRVEFVGPQVGEELKKQGLMAVLFSLLGIMAYVWFRFEWQFGVASIVALAHDAVATIGLFALTQMEFNLSTVAAVLMIAGYSINDTVVAFDRIRENLRKYKKTDLKDVLNMSVNQMLSRTLMTSITTLLALIALYMFGGAVIQGFVYALIFGIVIGTYSSVFIAAPLLLFMNIRRGESDTTPAETQEAG